MAEPLTYRVESEARIKNGDGVAAATTVQPYVNSRGAGSRDQLLVRRAAPHVYTLELLLLSQRSFCGDAGAIFSC